MHPGLRITRTCSTGREDLGRIRRREHLRPCQLLKAPNAADMVDMLMTLEQDANVLQSETKLANVRGDQVGAFLRAAVDQDMPLVPGDQIAEIPQVPTR